MAVKQLNALITGASSGIGKALAKELFSQGRYFFFFFQQGCP